MTDRDPFKYGVRDLSPFLRLRPLRLFTKTADIKGTLMLDDVYIIPSLLMLSAIQSS